MFGGHKMKKGILCVTALLFLLPSLSGAARVQLDQSFNRPRGFTLFNGSSNSFDEGFAVALTVQSDGKIIAVGVSNNGNDDDVLVLRYNRNGTLDPTFGNQGVFIYNGPAKNNDGGFAVALQSDQKIVVAGYSSNGTDRDLLVLRLLTNGTLDGSFNGTGVVTFNGSGNGDDTGNGVAIQTGDGKIVVVGDTYNGLNVDVIVLRYNTNGTLDTAGFGSPNGFITFDGPVQENDSGLAVAIQTGDGKIVVVGETDDGVTFNVLTLRLNGNGTLDTAGFGAPNGFVTYDGPAGFDDTGFAVVLQTDGKIVVVGDTDNGTSNDVLALRYNSDGSLDGTFGTGGVFTYNGPTNGNDEGFAVTLQPDGKIIIAGDSNSGTNADVLVLRLTKEGILDQEFGGGVFTFNGPANGGDTGNAVVVQPDGRIVVVGFADNGQNNDVLIFRLFFGDKFEAIPTLTGWGVMILIGLIGLQFLIYLRRRRSEATKLL